MDEQAIREGLYAAHFVQHRINSGYIQIMDGERSLPAFWAHPQIGGTFPGLVLIHGERGLNNQIRMRVRRFAELGYYVIAPELFGATFGTNDVQICRAALRKGGESPVLAALQVLRTHNRLNGKLGVVGWSGGGEIAFPRCAHAARSERRRDLRRQSAACPQRAAQRSDRYSRLLRR
jgi:dienelactone hydrolase